MHLDDRFKELKRRLIVIPCRRIEELSDERQAQMGVARNNWQSKLLDISAYDWKGFDKVFDEFWDCEMASVFAVTRKELSCQVRDLTSLQRAISLDLMATGVACTIWEDGEIASRRLKLYWDWFKKETEENAGLSELLKQFIRQEERNAKNGNRNLEIYTPQVRGQVDMWVAQGWVYEKPRPKEIKELMLDLGMRLQQGRWIKG